MDKVNLNEVQREGALVYVRFRRTAQDARYADPLDQLGAREAAGQRIRARFLLLPFSLREQRK